MKLFNKLKNVLFEEEEVEVPVKEPIKKEVPKPEKKPIKMTFETKEEEPIVSDRELFKAEKTFDFPDFDDKEFESMKHLPPKKEPEIEEEQTTNMSINLIDYEKPKNIKRQNKEVKKEEIKGRAYTTKVQEKEVKFKPSPVISPVYGILDKNYKKEDLIVEKKEKKTIDVDDVRKKAFGTLEEDLEKTLTKPVKKFYKEEIPKPKEEKSIEDLLEETAFDVIDIPKEPIEENNEIFDEELEQLDKKNEEENIEEDTLENDLFGLIDSMYEQKEEE